MDREIIVKGEGEVRVMPDRAIVRATIDGEGNERAQAYSDAAQSAANVDEVIADAGDAIARNTTAALLVHPKTRWRKGETIRTGWSASRSSVLEIVGFDALGELLARLATAGAAIHGPTWQLSADNPAYNEARRAAAADARARAEDYAVVLGLTLGPPAWVAEPGMRDSTRAEWSINEAAMLRAGAASEIADEIDITPAEMTVRATVEIGFAIL